MSASANHLAYVAFLPCCNSIQQITRALTAKHSSGSRRPFTVEEDARLMEIVKNSTSMVNWENVAKDMNNGRSSRQCRERYMNYLSPDIRTDPWTEVEDALLIQKMNDLGRCWSTISQFFNGRTENDVKNRWYSHLKFRSIDDGGKVHMISDPMMCPYPKRKKRNRTRVSPQQNAMKLLEGKEPTSTCSDTCNDTCNDNFDSVFDNFQQSISTINLGLDEKEEIDELQFVDFWDQNLIEDYADTKFEQDFMSIPAANIFGSFL